MPIYKLNRLWCTVSGIGLLASIIILSPMLQSQSVPPSSLAAAKALYTGQGIRLDFDKSFLLFQKAAAHGSLEASAWLGDMYLHGRGVGVDLVRGKQLVTVAADAGDPVGLRFTGVMYEEGRAVPQDFVMAKKFYERAAVKGDSVASGRLGMMYLFGRGGNVEWDKGKQLLKAGSVGGDPWSQVELGRIYMMSKTPGDKQLAVNEYTKAAESGNRVAAFRLGRLYEVGIAGETNLAKAAQLYSASAIKGYPFAQLALGRLYMNGRGVVKNDVRAYQMFTLAAKQGVTAAETWRVQLATRMNATQIAEASRMVQQFQANAARTSNSPDPQN